MADPLPSFDIEFDPEYTDHIREIVRRRFPGLPRNATHVSDLLYCLRRAWCNKQQETERQLDDDTLATFYGGTVFEDCMAEGETGLTRAYCFNCKAVSVVQGRRPDQKEQATCVVCGKRWLLYTTDWVVDGIVHECKQTRKSRRHGPSRAPNWIEQLATYVMFEQLAQRSTSDWGRIVANWLMGDYARAKKGEKPTPPRAGIDAYKVVFKPDEESNWDTWLVELRRRKNIVEGKEMPPLTDMVNERARSPVYEYECSNCTVGQEIGCLNYIWDDEGKEKEREVTLDESTQKEASNGESGKVPVA